ncbi:MAG: hypothetical protein K8F90_14815 [Hyphomicrobiales bacterium]|nr:hypothetical protein [Hyphomicrobiales bacterium]
MIPAARAYAHDVRKSLDLLAVASEIFFSSDSSHRIRINATPSFAMRWLIPRIANFHRQNPRIDIRLETSNTDELESSVDHSDLVI